MTEPIYYSFTFFLFSLLRASFNFRKSYCNRLAGRDFAAMGHTNGIMEICAVRTWCMHDKTVGDWIKQWFSGKCAERLTLHVISKISTVHTFDVSKNLIAIDMLETFWVICVTLHLWCSPEILASVSIFLSCSCSYLVYRWVYWAFESDFERGICSHTWGVLAAWHNVELFAAPPSIRTELYAKRPPRWEHVECCHVLSVPTPLVWAYFSNPFNSSYPGAEVVWHVVAL